MKKINLTQIDWIIIGFVLLKISIHLLTATNYELHRDAFLYIAQGEHLAWGFVSVPPGTAFVGKIFRLLFGDSVFVVRLVPALVGGVSVFMIGHTVKQLGGKTWAVILACSAFILSLAFLRTNSLYQPVSFNQFFWFLSCFFIVKLLKTENQKYLIHLGVTFGIAFLFKYSIVFLALAFLVALLISSKRNLLFTKQAAIGMGLGFLIILPNLIWQFNHNWPVLMHMQELRETQLVHVDKIGFLIAQLLMNYSVVFIWLAGLMAIFTMKIFRPYRVIGLMFFGVIVLLLFLSGKAYYTLGIYPILFVFGGLAFESWLKGRWRFAHPFLLFLMLFLLWPALPLSLLIYNFEQLSAYSETAKKRGMEDAYSWEDGEIHALPQDFADMTGWAEMADIVGQAYLALPDSQRVNCAIAADNYGEAGALLYHQKKYGYPDPICFNGSMTFWSPDSLHVDRLLYLSPEPWVVDQLFNTIENVGELKNPYARESGVSVFLCTDPKDNYQEMYATFAHEKKQVYERK